jgi:hypothetical protein
MTNWLPHELAFRRLLQTRTPIQGATFALACVERHGLEYLGQLAQGFGDAVERLWEALEPRTAGTSPGWDDAQQDALEQRMQVFVGADREQGLRGEFVTEDAPRSGPTLGFTLAFNSALCIIHAGQAQLSYPVDSATGAARQMTESLFAAYTSGGSLPPAQAATEFQVSATFKIEIDSQAALLEQALTYPLHEVRATARQAHSKFAMTVRRAGTDFMEA